MRLRVLGLLLALAAAAVAQEVPAHRQKQILDAAPAAARVKPQAARRVLIFNTPAHLMEKDPHKGYCIPYGSAAFEALGRKTGAYEPVVSDDLAQFMPANLRQYAAVVLNNTSGPWITPTTADLAKPAFAAFADAAAAETALRQSLLDWVSAGGGLVVVHFAIAGNAHWPAFAELVGGKFTGHPWNEEIGVTVEEPSHPLNAAFPADFRLADEIYEYGGSWDRSKVRVLLSLDPARTNMGVPWQNRKDNDYALTWVKSHGRGRVYNSSFGHRTELYWHPQVLAAYLDAVQFATGDLAAPTEPRPGRPERVIPGTQPVPGQPGFVSLFNGQDLAGWTGDERIWRVRDGTIVGETTAETRLTENSFLVWKDEVADFELKLKVRLTGGNSGIYYRSKARPPGRTGGEALVGPQADFSADGRWTGVIMEYTLRDVLAERGQRVAIDDKGVKTVTGTLGDPAELLKGWRVGDWNDYQVIARDGRVTLVINGQTQCELTDNDPKRPLRGWLAVQTHVGPPMRVEFRDVWLKR